MLLAELLPRRLFAHDCVSQSETILVPLPEFAGSDGAPGQSPAVYRHASFCLIAFGDLCYIGAVLFFFYR